MALDTVEYDSTVFEPGSEASRRADEALAVKFYKFLEQDQAETVVAGRPIFKDVDYISIRVRGTKDNEVQRPARADDKQRFPAAWMAYQTRETQAVKGTPLEQWPQLTRAQVEEFKYLGFFTVEDLAATSEAVLHKVPGLTTLKQRAIAFLDFANGTAPVAQLQSKVEALENEKQTLVNQLAEMGKRMDAIEAERKNAKK